MKRSIFKVVFNDCMSRTHFRVNPEWPVWLKLLSVCLRTSSPVAVTQYSIRYGIAYLVTRSILLPLVVLIYPLVVVVCPLVVLVYLLIVLVYQLVVLVCQFVSTRSTCLSTHSICLSTCNTCLAICLSTCCTRSAICRSFYDLSL